MTGWGAFDALRFGVRVKQGDGGHTAHRVCAAFMAAVLDSINFREAEPEGAA